jgi:SAM-dependent methyltransferase
MVREKPDASPALPRRPRRQEIASLVTILAKYLLFPGQDLSARCRYRRLSAMLRSGPIDTLDAGCGNGMLTYAAYLRGNRVLGVSNEASQVARAQRFYSALGVAPDKMEFRVLDLYNLHEIERRFHQIICAETLEHIVDDEGVLRSFADLLLPGGVLHLCCPYALHPGNSLGRCNEPEDGRHVRDGYTLERYEELLRPNGLEIVKVLGLGSPPLIAADRHVRRIRAKFGEAAAFPFFLAAWPFARLDYLDPGVPLSLYVQAMRPQV